MQEISRVEKATSEEVSTVGLAGKYLTFRLGDEEYAIAILKVVEINKLMMITRVPRMPEHVRGVINLRGRVIPVVELRRRFGMEPIEDNEETCIIVVRVGETQMGLLVDTVSEVLDIAPGDIEPAPRFGGAAGEAQRFILGMAKSKSGAVKMLLDIDRVIDGEVMESLLEN